MHDDKPAKPPTAAERRKAVQRLNAESWWFEMGSHAQERLIQGEVDRLRASRRPRRGKTIG